MRKFTTSWIEESGPIDPETLIRLAPGIYYRKNYLSNPNTINDMNVTITSLNPVDPEILALEFLADYLPDYPNAPVLYLDGAEVTGIGPAALAERLAKELPRAVVFTNFDRWPTTGPIITELVERHRVAHSARVISVQVVKGDEDRINIKPRF